MATLKERPDTWAARGIIARDHRHDKGDGYEETPHKSQHGKGKKKYKKKGCPGNNGKQHVWIWVKLRWLPDERGRQFDHYDPIIERYYLKENKWQVYRHSLEYLEGYEKKICCGCYGKPSWKTRAARKVD